MKNILILLSLFWLLSCNTDSVGDISTGEMLYTYSNGNLIVSNDFGTLRGTVINDKSFAGNNMFKMVSSTMGGVIVAGDDDVAPMHILNTAMGGNHGFFYNHATITAHGFTNEDIGTEFTQKGGAKKFYLMRIIDSNVIALLSENQKTAADPLFYRLGLGTMSRDGVNYTITNVAEEQMYPSIGELTQKVIANGTDIVTSVTSKIKTEKLEVVEEYVIYDPTSVLNKTRARAGSNTIPTYAGTPIVRVNNTYSFVKEKAILVFSTHQFYNSCVFQDIMCSQAVVIGSNDGITKYYVPNSNPLNKSVDLRKPSAIAWGANIPKTFVTVSASPNPAVPPNRVIQYRGNTGFMMAYVLTRGTGSNIPDYTDRTFEIRNNTGKIYPHPIEGSKVGTMVTADRVFKAAIARVYTNLSVTRVGNRLSMFEFSVDDEKHIYLDYSGNMTDRLVLNDLSLKGKKITVLESSNAVLMTPNYTDNLSVKANYVEGQTSYIVLMIK